MKVAKYAVHICINITLKFWVAGQNSFQETIKFKSLVIEVLETRVISQFLGATTFFGVI